MIDFRYIDIPKPIIFGKKKKLYDDNIYTFDIETVSLFKINGEFRVYDNNLTQEFYRDTEKVCCPYLWQFGVNDKVYFGREFKDFGKVLCAMSDSKVRKFVVVHNLSYEMQFLLDLVDSYNWHIKDMCARNLRKPIQFTIEELNITFRCSYMLTNLSLEKSAEKYTSVKKAVGDLDYNKAYSPLSNLPERALHYAEMDIITLYEIIKYFREEYGHIVNIPLTQTGEVRRALLHDVDWFYIKKQWGLVPSEHIYLALVQAFMGGITHSNILYTNKLFKKGVEGCRGVWSYDFSSSYPYVLVVNKKYPSEPFFAIRECDIDRYKSNHCLLYDVTLKNVKSKLFNHYIPYSKMFEVNEGSKGDYKLTIDNGRVVQVKSCRMIITDLDLQNIKDSYRIGKIKYNNIWASFGKYLDKRVIKFILERYASKTTLKGVEGQEDFYMKMKQQLNSVFGMSCTNQVKTGIDFDCDVDEWVKHELYEMVDDGEGGKIRFIDKKLGEMKKSYSTLFFYAVGVWCTAYARTNLWRAVRALDTDVIYYDTDSIKGTGEAVKRYVESYNKEVIEKLKQSSQDNDLPIELYLPKDKRGVEYPLGVFDNETKNGLLKEFKTLGAKKYAYKDNKNNLHITVAGVSKKAVVGLRSLKDFNKSLVFYPECTGKLTHYYNDEQPTFTYTDVDGNNYTCDQRHSIVLQPTSYSMSLTPVYERLIDEYIGILPNDTD